MGWWDGASGGEANSYGYRHNLPDTKRMDDERRYSPLLTRAASSRFQPPGTTRVRANASGA